MEECSFQHTEFLLQCMRQRRDLLHAIRFLTDSLTRAAQAADANVILGILARKEALLEEFSQVRKALQQFERDDPSQRAWGSSERRRECQRLADEGNRLLAEIIQIDEATLSEMNRCRDAIAAQLQNGTNSILAHNAYTAGEQIGECTLDLSNL